MAAGSGEFDDVGGASLVSAAGGEPEWASATRAWPSCRPRAMFNGLRMTRRPDPVASGSAEMALA